MHCAVFWDNRSDRSGKSEGGEGSAKGASHLCQTGILCARFARSWLRSPVSLSMQALQYGVAAALMGTCRSDAPKSTLCVMVTIQNLKRISRFFVMLESQLEARTRYLSVSSAQRPDWIWPLSGKAASSRCSTAAASHWRAVLLQLASHQPCTAAGQGSLWIEQELISPTS